MKYRSFLAVGGLIATVLLTACSSVRLSEAPVEDRSGVAAGKPVQAAAGSATGSAAGSSSSTRVGSDGAGDQARSATSVVAPRAVAAPEVVPRSGQAPVAGAGSQSGLAGTSGGPGSAGGAAGGSAVGSAGGSVGGSAGMAAVPANLRGTIIYFGFDSFDIAPEGLSLIDAHAGFLNANRGRSISVEGHADERGGREYNLALGQKRAEAVRRRLTSLGVSDGQIEAVSFGKEKPAVQGSSEAAYEKNRRAEIKYR